MMNSKKFPNRFCDDPKARLAPCSICKYRLGIKLACEAYPERIPSNIIYQVDKYPDRECAKGYKYTPKDDTTE